MSTRARRGSQALEFALVLPVMMALVSGVADYGWFFHQQSTVNTIARDATRRGSLGTAQAAAATAQSSGCSALNGARLATGLAADCGQVVTAVTGASPDAVLSVTVSVPFRPLVGLVPLPATVAANLSMRVEGT